MSGHGRTLVLATRRDLCPVCGGRGVVQCHIPDPPGDWPWPRFVSCPHCHFPYAPLSIYHRRSA